MSQEDPNGKSAMMIKVLQINLNRYRTAHDAMEDRVRRDDFDIRIISEANKNISKKEGEKRRRLGFGRDRRHHHLVNRQKQAAKNQRKELSTGIHVDQADRGPRIETLKNSRDTLRPWENA